MFAGIADKYLNVHEYLKMEARPNSSIDTCNHFGLSHKLNNYSYFEQQLQQYKIVFTPKKSGFNQRHLAKMHSTLKFLN